MSRCLLCKSFIRRVRSTDCKRCGATNVDPTVPDWSTSVITFLPSYSGPVTGLTSGVRMAYRWKAGK